MDWIIAYSIMAISIGTFCFIAYKRKESFKLALLAVECYILCFTVAGMMCLNLESIVSFFLNCDFSSPVFEIIFEIMKVTYFISIPMPVILTYYKIKKMEKMKNMKD